MLPDALGALPNAVRFAVLNWSHITNEERQMITLICQNASARKSAAGQT
jgi:predicted Fe-S protein YdhL (DUF1289 family)